MQLSRLIQFEKLQLALGRPTQSSLSLEALTALRARAAVSGCSDAQLASELLEVIARDNLFDAVIDSAPLQPAE